MMQAKIGCAGLLLALSIAVNPGVTAKEKVTGNGQAHEQAVELHALSEVVIQPKVDLKLLHQLGRRQQQNPPTLTNNSPQYTTIGSGQQQYWTFPLSEINAPQYTGAPVLPPDSSIDQDADGQAINQELRKRESETIYITLNVCSQPTSNGDQPSGPPPPLSLYVSYDANNKNPGPSYQGEGQTSPIIADGGRGYYEHSEGSDTYIGVAAPGNIEGFSGQWTYQITVSNQMYYTNFFQDQNLGTLDSDLSSAFFVTQQLADVEPNDTGLAQQWLNTGGPFGIFIYDADDPTMAGINQSFCGLSNYALVKGNLGQISSQGVETSMRLYNNTQPYQQFYVPQLNKSSNYKAALALTGDYSLKLNQTLPGGGGSIWTSMDFSTRAGDTNCQLIYNLTFCDEVAYSVPTNSTYYNNVTGLAALYDNFTSSSLWPYFQNSLDQIPCGTSNDAKYSLVRTCEDCSQAYKKWVCAVSIPRCGDVSSSASFLKLRNTQEIGQQDGLVAGNFRNGSTPDLSNPEIGNLTNAQARNQNLSNFVSATGPYNEILPCDTLCYSLVQSCPSILGFACPWRGKGLEWGYGSMPAGESEPVDGYPVCNMPGAIWGINEASSSSHYSPILMISALFLAFLAQT